MHKYNEVKFSSGSRIKPGFTTVEKFNPFFFFLKTEGKCLTCISSGGITVPYLKNLGQLSLFLQSQCKHLSLGNGEAGMCCRNEKSFSVETKENNSDLSKTMSL